MAFLIIPETGLSQTDYLSLIKSVKMLYSISYSFLHFLLHWNCHRIHMPLYPVQILQEPSSLQNPFVIKIFAGIYCRAPKG